MSNGATAMAEVIVNYSLSRNDRGTLLIHTDPDAQAYAWIGDATEGDPGAGPRGQRGKLARLVGRSYLDRTFPDEGQAVAYIAVQAGEVERLNAAYVEFLDREAMRQQVQEAGAWTVDPGPWVVVAMLTAATEPWRATNQQLVTDCQAANASLRQRQQAHDHWKSGLNNALLAYAREHDLEPSFEELLIEHDRDGRPRDWMVTVAVSGEVTISVRADSEDAARERVTDRDVENQISQVGLDGMDWRVSEVEEDDS